MPSFILIHATVWPQYTNVTDSQDRQWSDSIGRTVLQTVAQKPLNRSRCRLGCGLNTFGPSMYGSDAAFLSNYFHHLFTFFAKYCDERFCMSVRSGFGFFPGWNNSGVLARLETVFASFPRAHLEKSFRDAESVSAGAEMSRAA